MKSSELKEILHRIKLVNVVSGVPQGGVLGPLLFLNMYTSEFFSIQGNKLVCYSDDSTLMAVVPKAYRLKEVDANSTQRKRQLMMTSLTVQWHVRY